MEKIPLPHTVAITHEDGHEATFELFPYFPGYGPTVANALRRVLLSSLPGAAITAVRLENVNHEFSTIPGVKEDVISILLNLKQVRLRLHQDGPFELTMRVKGEKVVTAGAFEKNADVDIVNPDHVVATMTDDGAEFLLRATVRRGRGYVPVEQREGEERPLSEIAVDAVYTPVERVSFRIENVRVGQETEHHKLILTIRTDGTLTPREALSQAASILEDHYATLVSDLAERLTYRAAEASPEAPILSPMGKQGMMAMLANNEDSRGPVPEERLVAEEVMGAVRAPEEHRGMENRSMAILQLPVNTRIQNVLEVAGIRTVGGLLQKTRQQILDIEGIGEKAVEEIESALRDLGLKLREERKADE